MTQPPGKIAHLQAWVAFEAAARAGTFASAAEELSVTPAAVSQHVRTLESYLDVRLFFRTGQGVALTPEGQKVVVGVRDGLRSIAGAVGLLQHRELRSCIRVSASPSFASRWLLPRIHRFNNLHPAISVKLDATPRVVDLDNDNVDVAIRYGRGTYAGYSAEYLFEEHVFPVGSPALISTSQRRDLVALLRMLPLIHDTTVLRDGELPGWSAWLHMHGIAGVDCSKGLFLDSGLAVQAAVDGRGLLLGRSIIVADDLAAGRLVRPVDQSLKVPQAYYLVRSPRAGEAGKIAAFRQWLLNEVALTRAACGCASNPPG
ncbi:MAG: LysR substrate-binding domain-containing protein [Ramlibacter sp.]|nr:LysR substrate-binding domain-containing protein [Ramlibacter sp.]